MRKLLAALGFCAALALPILGQTSVCHTEATVVTICSIVGPDGQPLPEPSNQHADLSDGSAMVIGAGFGWTTPEGFLHNPTEAPIVQKVGRITFIDPSGNFEPIIFEPTVTVEPHETRRIKNWHTLFDPDSGIHILAIEPDLEASARYAFGTGVCRTTFDLEAIARGLKENGDRWAFHRVSVDAEAQVGAFPVFMNPNPEALGVAIAVFGRDGESFELERIEIPSGVSQYEVQTQIPDGGSLLIVLSQLGGVPLPVRVFVPVGPRSGATLGIRYPEPQSGE